MSFLALDAPRHTRMRALVSQGFTPRRVRDLEPRIRELARGTWPRLPSQDTFDFVADFAGKLPMDVISELMGVPEADRAELRRLADAVMHREDGVIDVPQAGIEASLTLIVYYPEMVADRRQKPHATI